MNFCHTCASMHRLCPLIFVILRMLKQDRTEYWCIIICKPSIAKLNPYHINKEI